MTNDRTIEAYYLTGVQGGYFTVSEFLPVEDAKAQAIALAEKLGERVIERSYRHSGVFVDIGMLGLTSDIVDCQDRLLDAAA